MSTPLRERPDAPLGTLIFRAGLLPAETIENALEEGVKTGRRLGEILIERGLLQEEDLTRLLAGQKGLRIELKYFEGQPAIQHVSRISKPGRRVYSGSQELPRVRNGLGITIVSTPRGVLSDAEAREQNVGGEVLAEVF